MKHSQHYHKSEVMCNELMFGTLSQLNHLRVNTVYVSKTSRIQPKQALGLLPTIVNRECYMLITHINVQHGHCFFFLFVNNIYHVIEVSGSINISTGGFT